MSSVLPQKLLFPSLSGASWFSGPPWEDEHAHLAAWESFHEQQVKPAELHAIYSLETRMQSTVACYTDMEC